MHEFAMVLTVTPLSKEAEFERLVRAARAEPGMSVTVCGKSVIQFCISDAQEFLAIDRAHQWLEEIGKRAGITVKTNAQPSNEC